MRPTLRGPPASPHFVLALTTLSLLATGASLGAQTVVGRVVVAAPGDGEAPISGASVTLLDRDFSPVARASTDGTGSFVVEASDPGSYLLLVERDGFASHLTAPLTLRPEVLHEERISVEPVRLDERRRDADPGAQIAVREEHLGDLCGSAPRPDRGVLVGVVVGAETGRTVGGARAVAEWTGGRPTGIGGVARPERLELSVGETGVFVLCGVPTGTDLRLRAVGSAGAGEVTVTRVARAGVVRVDLTLPEPGTRAALRATPGTGSVLGRVTDWESGEPVQAARVTLGDPGRSAVTDADGRFVLDSVPAGNLVLVVHHVAYPHQELVLPVRGGAGHDVEVRLVSEAIPLAPLRVTVRSTRWFRNMRGFTQRARAGVGHFIPPEEIRQREPSVLLDLVRSVPGIRVRSGAGPHGEPRMTIRGRRCSPEVWVDRAPWRSDDPFTSLRGAELEAVEIYRGITEIPAEFAGAADVCGAVVVWTRKVRVGEVYSSAR